MIVTVKAKHPVRGDMQLKLFSPSQTESVLLDFRDEKNHTRNLSKSSSAYLLYVCHEFFFHRALKTLVFTLTKEH